MINVEKKVYGRKSVTIEIGPALNGIFEMDAVEINSPLNYYGNSNEIVMMFGCWLKNTLDAMNQNNAKTLRIYCSWS